MAEQYGQGHHYANVNVPMSNISQFRLIYQEDVINALTAAHGTMLATGGNGEFARGFIAALAAIALAFGIRSNSYVGMFQKQLKEEGEQYA